MIEWHREQRQWLTKQIGLFSSGQAQFREIRDGVTIDATLDLIADLDRRLAEIDEFVKETDPS